jgi:formylglycine-generating enzyme required for sulfatase activity
MLSQKVFLLVAVLAALCVFIGCGKKSEEQQGETAKPAKSVVEPGEMVMVPAGEFIMGSNVKGTDNKETVAYPEHKVNLPAFWIDKYEVTNFQMLDFAIKESYTGEGAKEGKDWRLFATPDKALFPVQYVTYNDAQAYCKSVGKRLPAAQTGKLTLGEVNGWTAAATQPKLGC